MINLESTMLTNFIDGNGDFYLRKADVVKLNFLSNMYMLLCYILLFKKYFLFTFNFLWEKNSIYIKFLSGPFSFFRHGFAT